MLHANQNFLQDPLPTTTTSLILPNSPAQLHLDIRQSLPKTLLRIHIKDRIAGNNIAGQDSLPPKGPAWSNRYSPFELIGSHTLTAGPNLNQQRFINHLSRSLEGSENLREGEWLGEADSTMIENYENLELRASPSIDITNRPISRASRFSVSSVSTSSSGLSSMSGRSESVCSAGWASDESSPRAEMMKDADDVENGDVPPKIEELDEDIDMTQVLPSQPSEEMTSATMTIVKRGRGRPRKHPIVEKPDTKGKSGRSKTGMIFLDFIL